MFVTCFERLTPSVGTNGFRTKHQRNGFLNALKATAFGLTLHGIYYKENLETCQFNPLRKIHDTEKLYI